MRTVKTSLTARRQLKDILTEGVQKFGEDVADRTATRIDIAVHSLLCHFPDWFAKEAYRGLHTYAVPKTPVVVAYNFDEKELRVHFIFHQGQNREGWKPTDAQW